MIKSVIVSRQGRDGFTLLEAIIASAIFAIISSAALSSITTLTKQQTLSFNINHQQTMVDIWSDQITMELQETRLSQANVDYFEDMGIPEEASYALTFPTARSANGVFYSTTGTPQPIWKGLVIYYCDVSRIVRSAVTGEFCLYKYVLYGNFSYPIKVSSITTSAVNLSNGQSIPKSNFSIVLNGVTQFYPVLGNPCSIDIEVKAESFEKGKTPAYIGFHFEVSCRN